MQGLSARTKRIIQAVAFLSCLLAFDPAVAPASSSSPVVPVLRFVAPQTPDRLLSLATLRSACPTREIEVSDPYHERAMRYFALPLRCVLDQGFPSVSERAGALEAESLLLRALDGYTRPASGTVLLDAGAHLAFGEVALMSGPDAPPRFTPIERRRIDPAPFYLVWSGAEQSDPHVHPWPYQLGTIEIASFSSASPRTVPEGLAPSDPGWRGYTLFQESCASCHSINGQGGKVGPDLNVPRSIVEYRPIEQIKGYVRDPQATRYTSMPAHPDLGDADLDALIAYFEAMRVRKHDPRERNDS